VPRRVRARTSKPPAARRRGETYFYASEVVKVAGLKGIDYAQLRRLLVIARGPVADGRWARYTFADIAAVRAGARLVDAVRVLKNGQRLQLGELERACDRLRSLGVTSPLLEVPMKRVGRTIVADIDGLRFRPATDQLVLDETLQAALAYLKAPATVTALSKARAQLRRNLEQEKRAVEKRSRGSHRTRPGPLAL
jgi:hypothetical protein